jgi:hypothetical protein
MNEMINEKKKKIKVLQEKPVTVALCLPEIPYALQHDEASCDSFSGRNLITRRKVIFPYTLLPLYQSANVSFRDQSDSCCCADTVSIQTAAFELSSKFCFGQGTDKKTDSGLRHLWLCESSVLLKSFMKTLEVMFTFLCSRRRVGFLGGFAKLREAIISFVMSVRPSTFNNSAPTRRIFIKI